MADTTAPTNLRDLKRAAAKKAFALIVATNAQLPDKAAQSEPIAEMVDAIVAVAVETTLHAIHQRIATARNDRRRLPKTCFEQNCGHLACDELAYFDDAIYGALMPLTPPDPPEAPKA
jgi:hypothetical protein